jgi:hypothetical protein
VAQAATALCCLNTKAALEFGPLWGLVATAPLLPESLLSC